MSEVIVCRSDAEVNDTEVMDTHDFCTKALNMCGPMRYWGSKRDMLVNLRDRCESVILGERTFREAFAGRALPMFQYHWIVLKG